MFPLNQFEGISFNLICDDQTILHVYFIYNFLNKLYCLLGHVNNYLNCHVPYWSRFLLCFHHVNDEFLFSLADDDKGQRR